MLILLPGNRFAQRAAMEEDHRSKMDALRQQYQLHVDAAQTQGKELTKEVISISID